MKDHSERCKCRACETEKRGETRLKNEFLPPYQEVEIDGDGSGNWITGVWTIQPRKKKRRG